MYPDALGHVSLSLRRPGVGLEAGIVTPLLSVSCMLLKETPSVS